MKIYFAGSIRGGRDDQEIYDQHIQYLKSKGVEVLCEHVGYKELTDQGNDQDPKFIHNRDLDWVKRADGVIAEVTNPSLGVGYELGKATEWKKPILALYRQVGGKSLSAMISGSAGIKVVTYAVPKDVHQPIDDFLNSLT